MSKHSVWLFALGLVAAAWLIYQSPHEGHGIVTAFATLFIAFFTATLWIATQGLKELAVNQEEAIRKHERAYLFCGGVFGVPRHSRDGTTLQMEHAPKASYYMEPWRMMIHNFGRTPGFIKKIEWGVCHRGSFPHEQLVSAIIDKKMLPVATVDVRAAIAPTGVKPISYRYVEPGREVETVFFGRIFYEDVFGKKHHSAFAMLHRAEHTDTIGPSFADDWS